jgi:hypothetical protein
MSASHLTSRYRTIKDGRCQPARHPSLPDLAHIPSLEELEIGDQAASLNDRSVSLWEEREAEEDVGTDGGVLKPRRL